MSLQGVTVLRIRIQAPTHFVFVLRISIKNRLWIQDSTMQLYTLGAPESQQVFLPKTKAAALADKLREVCVGSKYEGTRELETEIERISMLAERGHKAELVAQAMEIALEKDEVNFDYVREEMFRLLNKNTARFNHCTAGQTVLEVTANGDYARCIRYAKKGRFIGNIFEDRQFKLLDLDTQSDCNVHCNKRMCHARSTIRTATREEFDEQLAEKGIRGDYGDFSGRVHLPNAKMCVRWRITETCNYRCSYCSAWQTVNKKLPELEGDRLLETAKIILDQFDGVWLRITGGEPSVVRNYVELMQYLHSRLDRIAQIEIRTNFSYPKKQREIFALDWQRKLHYHIGCHVYDVNFKPWEWLEFLPDQNNIDYVVKFVRSKVNASYVDAFRNYFIYHGIHPDDLRIIFDMRDKAEDNSDVPPAYRTLQDHDELVTKEAADRMFAKRMRRLRPNPLVRLASTPRNLWNQLWHRSP